ncbi:hypothetical protein JCM5350_006259 [Sporobolomyces pararoseus]
MGLIPRSNHLVLIKECYPPAPSSSSSSPSEPIPPPVSNGLGKLSFYAVNRPKKLPKVINVLLERATKDRHSSGTKARQDLGVTLEIIKGLLVECGESGKDGAGELVKAVAEEALKAAELALSGEGSGRGKKRDPEMEAKGASLFGTVATLLTPPFFGLQEGFGKQYLRCLSFISDLAQLQGSEAESSRLVALQALEAAARSDILYQTANDFELEIEHLAPALVASCYPTPAHDLKKLFNATDAETGTSRLSPSLSNRKPLSISAPSSPPSQNDLASIAVPTLRLIARLSDSSQLLSLHSAISTFLNRHRSGELWHGNSQNFVEWLASSLLAASAPSYRPGVLQWWVDQVREINETEAQHKSVTLLYVLATLLRGKTHLHGLGVGGVLNTLGELLIRRAKISSTSTKPPPSPTNPLPNAAAPPPTDSAFSTEHHDVDYPRDRDLLTRPILSTISALSSKIYYSDQLENLISDIIDLIKGLRLEEGGGSNREDRIAGATKLVVAMRLLLEEAHRSSHPTGDKEDISRDSGTVSRSSRNQDMSEATIRQSGGSTTLEPPHLPPPVGSDQTLRTNGLNLGSTTPVATNGKELEDDVFTVRGKKEATEPPRPSIIVDDIATPGRSSAEHRKRVSPRTFEKSLFLLNVGDSILRAEYVRAAVVYLEQELDIEGIEKGSSLPPDLAYFWKSLHSSCFVLATSPNLSASFSTQLSPSSRPTTADPTHPLTRVRSHRSLRGMSVDSTNSSRPPTIVTSTSIPPSGPASPFDYSSITHLLETSHRIGSATAVLEGVPMLLALDRQAEEWVKGSDGRERSNERLQASKEIVAYAVRQIGRSWKIREIEQLGQDALETMTPSVLPPFGTIHHAQTSFASRSNGSSTSTFDHQTVIDALAFSDSLQASTGLDRTSLATLLGASWTPELASRVRSSSFVSPYSNGGAVTSPSRSILQLPLGSSARIASNASTHTTTSPPSRGPGSMRTPSLADLQSSLGGGGGSPSVGTRSARQSQTPSLSSMNGGRATGGSSSVFTTATGVSDASPSKRRTMKMSPEVLNALRTNSSSVSPRSNLRPSLTSTFPLLNKMGAVRNSHGMGESTVRPESDKVIQDIADYVHNYKIESDEAYSTARLCLIDTIGCGLEGLRVSPECKALMDPIVPGTVVPNGTKIPGTPFQMDPVRGAFAIGTQIRWLDFNDKTRSLLQFLTLTSSTGWLAAEWGHPSDNLGAILAVADYLARTGEPLKMKDVLEAMIKAHEIQGCMALENSFNRVGLDHVILVKLASAAVVSKMLGLTRDQTVDVVSQVFVDGQSLRTFRHAPNTGSRKSWSAGDACMRAVHLALQVKRGQMGIPTVLTAKTWGFYDVLFKGNEFKFQRPYGSYIMENVLFKISFPAEFHAQTAAEAAHIIHKQLKDAGKSSDDIKHVKIRTQEAAIRIIDKSGPLHNFADRDHTIQYMVAVPLIFGRLTTEDYSDRVAADPRIDELRAKIQCVEDKQFTADYHDPEKRFIGNALTVTLNDGTVLDEVECLYPIGHRRRREEGIPVLNAKFKRHVTDFFDSSKCDEIFKLVSDQKTLENMPVNEFTDLFVTKE